MYSLTKEAVTITKKIFIVLFTKILVAKKKRNSVNTGKVKVVRL